MTHDDPTCGALSCTRDAKNVIDHPRHGEVVVCEDHVDGYDVIRELEGSA